MVHRINIFLLSISLVIVQIFTMNQALAGAAEKWEIVENVYDKSKNTVNVTAKKIGQQAANSGSYKVQIPVSASTLGKSVKMMMWTGLAVAGVQAMLEGIGWIIDEGSKVIKRPVPVDPNPASPSNSFYYALPYGGFDTIHFSTPDAACRGGYDMGLGNSTKDTYPDYSHTNGTQCFTKMKDRDITFHFANVQKYPNPNYDPSQAPTEPYEYLSDSALGDEILGKGENKTPLPAAITDAYSPNNPVSNAPAPKQTADALDNANPQPDKEPAGDTAPKPNVDTDGDGIPDTYDPNAPPLGDKFQLPNFCEWAPSVCDFFTVQKQDNKEIKENQKLDTEQNKTFFDSVKEWFDWTKEDANYPDSQEVEINQTIPVVPNTSYFSWGAYCPFTAGSQTISIENTSAGIDYDLTSWCELASDIRPFVLAAGALMSFLIAAGVVMGRDD